MPPHPSHAFEKSPIETGDYEGLQVDTRPREDYEKHFDESKPRNFLDNDFSDSKTYLNEKRSHSAFNHPAFDPDTSPTSPNSEPSTGFSPISPEVPSKNLPTRTITPNEVFTAPPPVPPERKILGLKRKRFWELFLLLLALLIAAAIIGGVVGGLQARNGDSRSSTSSPPASNDTNTNSSNAAFTPLRPEDVVAGSPLAMVTYDEGPGESLVARQAFRMCFQTANGNIKEAVSYHEEAWISAMPIFTDAINNTGLATITYLNQTTQIGSIFYVGDNGFLQEKRKAYNSTGYWEPGTLNSLNLPMRGNVTLPEQGDDPKNDWEGYRMAAVYSVNFDDGPGARLFYHAVQLDGTSFVQEVVWNQKNDSWSKGAEIRRPYPNSHLAAAVDETSGILRLFYSSGNKTLSEDWLNTTDTKAGYSSGLDFPGILYDNAADIAAASLYGTTYVYHYSATSQTAQAGIHELSITGVPNSVSNQETYNLSAPLVAAPMLTMNGVTSPYQPLAVSYSAVTGVTQALYVFWADQVTGDPSTNMTGYGQLSQTSRPIGNATWPTTGQQPIPLGTDNSTPS